MANYCSHRRTNKCSVSSKGQRIGLWLWCTVFLCLIRLPCILTRCYPEGQANVRLGEPLEIFCIADNPGEPDYSPENLRFLLNTTIVNGTELINATTRRLFIPNPEKSVKTYHCRNNKEKCVIRALVDSAPMDVIDFNCVSHNLIYLMCNWTVPPHLALINYSISVEFKGHIITPENKVVSGPRENEYHWKWESIYRQQEEIFNIRLNGTNQFGTNIQNFFIDHFSVVKPDKPSLLQVLNVKSHQVQLRWNIPNTMVDFLGGGIDHRIEYQIEKTSYFQSVNATGLPKSKNLTYTFLLKNLPYAHMKYEVRIYIRPTKASKEEFWSYNFIVFMTASERPRRPPETIAGAFSETEFDTNRNVLIYWKQLEEYEEAGANFTYIVNITQNGVTKTKQPYKNTSLSYLKLDNVPYAPMLVSVYSVNEVGTSENSSHLYIPAKTDSSLKVTTFSQIAYYGNLYKLSWIGNDQIDNYTLFWCQNNVTNLCNGRLNFTVLDAKRNSHEISVPKQDRYQFAISANKGMSTSGIIWATCDISNDTLPMYSFPVKVEKEGYQGKTYVNIKWSLTCSIHLEENQTTIKGYRISYCVILKTSSECDPSYERKQVPIPNPRQMQKNITGLLPHKTYLFSLSMETIYGWKNLTNALTETTTLEDTPTSPRFVNVSEIRSNSIVLSFDPPDPRNGIIGNYKIYNFGALHKIVNVANDNTDLTRRHVNITDLDAFTRYGWTVTACNTGINSCSPAAPNEPILVKTKIGRPTKLRPPQILRNPDKLKWFKPEKQGGNDTFFQVKVVRDNIETDYTIYNETIHTHLLLPQCVDVRFGEKYLVRAVNRDGHILHAGEWSDPSTNNCNYSGNTTMVLVFLTLFGLIAIGYACVKFYNKYRLMDIKVDMPPGLRIPEPEKYTIGGWNPANKETKTSADEILPLTAKNAISLPEVKQKDNSNCNSSDHTDSTALSDISRGPIDRHPSTSDDDSNSSLNLEVDAAKVDGNIVAQDEEYSFNNSDNDSLRDAFNDKPFKANPPSIVNPATGYVQSVPTPLKSVPPRPPSETASSSYVKAALAPSIFTTGVVPPPVKSHPPTSSGYVLREDAHANTPNLRPSMPFGPDSLPSLPILPQSVKHGADIQLQSLNSLPSLKPTDRNVVPLCKPSAPSIGPGDPVINKHFNNILSAGQMAEEAAILDPKMSPDAYCRFSWSTDPANDNLQSLYSPNINSYKN